MTVLDLGCGYGHFTIPAAQIVCPAPVIGIDIDTPILAEARKAAIYELPVAESRSARAASCHGQQI